jgi:hypothetical protein
VEPWRILCVYIAALRLQPLAKENSTASYMGARFRVKEDAQ